jgi:hypothetical protein
MFRHLEAIETTETNKTVSTLTEFFSRQYNSKCPMGLCGQKRPVLAQK